MHVPSLICPTQSELFNIPSLVPRPPSFFFCSSVCVQYNTQKRKSCEEWGMPGNTYHVNDVWWMRGGRQTWGVRGPHPICSWALPPTTTLRQRHVVSFPQPSPFFAALSLLCIILNTNQRTKKGGSLGTRLVHSDALFICAKN